MQDCGHGQERPENVVISHSWLIVRFCAIRNWRLKQSCKLLECWRCTPVHTYNPKDRRLIGSNHLKKSLSNQQMTIKLNEQSFSGHIQGRIHFTALTQESYWTNSSNNHKPLREQSDFQSYHVISDFQRFHIILFKIFSFQQNYEIYKEIGKKV